ncbi:MAG: hypothetical protein ACI4P5_05110, partial [Candidatus Fimadaptatus sp.]
TALLLYIDLEKRGYSPKYSKKRPYFVLYSANKNFFNYRFAIWVKKVAQSLQYTRSTPSAPRILSLGAAHVRRLHTAPVRPSTTPCSGHAKAPSSAMPSQGKALIQNVNARPG